MITHIWEIILKLSLKSWDNTNVWQAYRNKIIKRGKINEYFLEVFVPHMLENINYELTIKRYNLWVYLRLIFDGIIILDWKVWSSSFDYGQ